LAEKDVLYTYDSETVFEVRNGDMVMTMTVKSDEGPISCTRYFSRYDKNLKERTPNPSRRTSISATANLFHRGSMKADSRGPSVVEEID